MALQVSETFRQNCYDLSKNQRALLLSDDVALSNEDIDAEKKLRFNIASITEQQVQFGETPINTIGVSILNEDGRINADSIVGKEFNCYMGVEVSKDDFYVPSNAISAIDTNDFMLSVHSEEPYVRGNCTFESLLPQLMNGDMCKIMFIYDSVFFVVDDGTNRYYAKHHKVGYNSYSDYETPSELECAMLDRLMDVSKFNSLSFYKGGMSECYYKSTTQPIDMWSDLKVGTWGVAKNKTWGEHSGYTTFESIEYESVEYGVWHFNRPRRINTAVLSLSGKDRMTIFEEDSADFASSMANTLVTAREMVIAIANYKGVSIGDLSGMNALADEITIDPKVYHNSKSLKDLLSYSGEVCGVSIFFDRWGNLSCTNSENEPVEIPYCYSFDVADCVAHTIGKMLIYHQGDFFEYQEDSSVENGVTYEWGENPYFNKSNPSGSWFSNNMHKKYGGFRNAITNTEADYSLWCDDVYSWTDEDITYREPIFTMEVEWNGSGRVTYSNYGEETRPLAQYDKRIENVSSINDDNLQGFNKAKYAQKLSFDERGLTVEANGMRIVNSENKEVFYADDEGNLTLEGRIRADSGNIGKWQITDTLSCSYGGEYVVMGVSAEEPRITTGTDAPWVSELTDCLETKIKGNAIEFFDNQYNGFPHEAFAWIRYDINTDASDLAGRILHIGCMANTSGGSVPVVPGLPTVRIQSQHVDVISYNPATFSNNIGLKGVTSTTGSANTWLSSEGTYGRSLYIVSSLRKNKDNIKTIENASEKVDNLRGVSFTSKCEADNPNQVFYGFIAEEVEKAVPELASYEGDKLQSVQYDRVCALLVEDLKSCHRRIEELESRLAELEKRSK